MAFTVEDYHSLVRLLVSHPECKVELRGLLLSEELLSLPATMRELAQRQLHTEEQLRALTEQVRILTEGQQRLTEGQQRLTEQVRILTEEQARLTEQVRFLTEGQQRLTDIVGELKGDMLEISFRNRAGSYFGRLLKRPKVIELSEEVDVLREHLEEKELEEVFLLDLVVGGTLLDIKPKRRVLLALEISHKIGEKDVERAVLRATFLRKAGFSAIPVVAGKQITPDLRSTVQTQKVVLLEDGKVRFWEEAVGYWIDGAH